MFNFMSLSITYEMYKGNEENENLIMHMNLFEYSYINLLHYTIVITFILLYTPRVV